MGRSASLRAGAVLWLPDDGAEDRGIAGELRGADSEGQVSNLLIHDQERFQAEKHELACAGLSSSNWHLADSSSMRIDGENAYCHALANAWYTVFTTKRRKDRQTWLEVVQQSTERRYCLNTEALDLLATMGLAAARRRRLAALLASAAEDQEWGEKAFAAWLDSHVPGLGPQQRQQVLDATAIAAYHAQTEWPVMAILGSDDAPEFNYLATIHGLCWVHDGRHYTKLTPFLPHHQESLTAFRKEYWEFYRRLAAYHQRPSPHESQRLRTTFRNSSLARPTTGP